jgi:hypothetical protein
MKTTFCGFDLTTTLVPFVLIFENATFQKEMNNPFDITDVYDFVKRTSLQFK